MNTERKDSVPKGFTLSMALMDCLPVLFFTISAIFIALHFPSLLLLIGIFFVILAGLLKVSWKLIIALAHRDIRFFNIQLRYLMPLGFLLALLALFIDHTKWSVTAIIAHITQFPSYLFFLIGMAGLIYLGYLGKHQDSHDAKANWKEQCINTLSQFCIMLGILL